MLEANRRCDVPQASDVNRILGIYNQLLEIQRRTIGPGREVLLPLSLTLTLTLVLTVTVTLILTLTVTIARTDWTVF